jgi:hypothetical protein
VLSHHFHFAIGAALSAASLAACQPADRGESSEASHDEAAGDAAVANVVDIAARDYVFVGPAEIPSGWTTFRLTNEGMEHHFLLLNLLPEGKTFEDYVAEVALPFDSAWHELRNGTIDKTEAGAMLGRLLPEWYASVRQMGGPGLVAPGGIAQVSVNLVPGDYVMECYVKTPDGEFHAVLGMAGPLTVTEASTGASPPAADLAITLFNHVMEVEGTPAAGEQTVAVHFEEHPEFGLGNDVHLVRLDEESDLERVVSWMDWMNVDGLRAPAPASFVGGLHEMPLGYTGFFTVDLAPGRFAWLAESNTSPGMVREFTVE